MLARHFNLLVSAALTQQLTSALLPQVLQSKLVQHISVITALLLGVLYYTGCVSLIDSQFYLAGRFFPDGYGCVAMCVRACVPLTHHVQWPPSGVTRG